MKKFIHVQKIHEIGICSMNTNIVDQNEDYDRYLDILSQIGSIIYDIEKECWIENQISILKLKEIYGEDIEIEINEPEIIPSWGEIKFPFINSNFN